MVLDAKIPVRIEMMAGMCLHIKNPGIEPRDYPASRIQKGLVLVLENRDLSEEGIGFAVPVIKFGHESIFPGNACITTEKNGETTVVNIDYDMNLVERMVVKSRKKIDNKAFYKIKEYFSRLHREYPQLRRILAQSSNSLRCACGIETKFEKAVSAGIVSMMNIVDARKGTIHVSVDMSKVKNEGCTGVNIMNELGANHFDSYRDSNGLFLRGNAIGTWDETFADEASFIDSRDKIAFTLNKVKGTRMFRGRELVEGRLSWSGLAYVLPRDIINFAYDIRIGAPE
ncbi:MAG: hypothetical protein O8C64_00175 [Candidatus Methanoperedens sp.]|nr:hypothetical protein [Candidatus Methanoperedens sp.]MCZ7403557.1 hypothetical protein [Candidatus Methanoperedens sp.]